MTDPPTSDPSGSESPLRDFWIRSSAWLFGKVVNLYPEDVRSEFGAAMRETFEAGLPEHHGVPALAWVVREILTVLHRASQERWEGARRAAREISRLLLSSPARLGARRLARSPFRAYGTWLMVFSAAVLVTIAASLRKGITESVSLIDGDAPQYLLFGTDHTREWARTHLGAAEIIRLGREAPSVDVAGAFTAPSAVHWVDASGRPRSIRAVYGTSSAMALLGLDLVAGSFRASAGGRGVVVTHEFWQSELSGAPDILQQSLDLGRNAYGVVGVLAPGARSADYSDFDVWITLSSAAAAPGPDPGRGLRIPQYVGIVQLRYGASAAAAQAEMSALTGGTPDRGVRLVSRAEYAVEGVRFGVRMFMLGALGLSALAMVELSWMAGADRLREEVRIRRMLGAPRIALWAEDVISIGVVSSVATAIGSAGAYALVPHLPSVLGWPAAVGASPSLSAGPTVAGAFILAHAVGATTRHIRSATGARKPPSRQVAGQVLVGMHAGTALILLVVAGGLGARFLGLRADAPGLGQPGVLMIETDLSALPPGTAHRLQMGGADGAAEHAQADAAGLWAPDAPDVSFWFDDISPTGRPGDIRTVPRLRVWGDALDVLGITVLEGRPFTRDDHRGADCVALVSTSLATDLWPSASPIDATIDVNHGSARCRVVGRVSDMRHTAAPNGEATLHNVYFALSQWPSTRVSWVYSNPLATPEAIEGWIQGLGSGIAVRNRAWLDVRQATRTRPLQQAASVSGLLALLAAALGLLSNHHTMRSYANTQRRSLALRAAIGASPMTLGLRILRVGMVPQVVGLGLAAAACLVFRESLASWLGLAHVGWYGLGAGALLLGMSTAVSIPVSRVAAGGDVARALHPD